MSAKSQIISFGFNNQFIVHLHAYSVKTTDKHLFVEPGFELGSHPIDLYETSFGKCIRLRYNIYKS